MFDHFDTLARNDSTRFEVIWDEFYLRVMWRFNGLKLCRSFSRVYGIVNGKENIEEESERAPGPNEPNVSNVYAFF